MSKEMLELADRIRDGLAIELDADAVFAPPLYRKEWRMIERALRASAVAEPVAYTNEAQISFLREAERSVKFSNVLLYTHPSPAATVPASVREALMLFADPSAWRLGGSCDPNSGAFRGQEIAQRALASLPAPEAAPTREEIADWLTPEALGNILWPSMFPPDWRELSNEGAMQQARFYCLEKAEKIRAAILALKAAPAK